MTEPDKVRPPVLMGIQYLRGLSATTVVVYHACRRYQVEIPIGEASVDLFFMISGFIMFSVTSAATRPWPFVKDRIIRIVPPYWITTTVLLAAGIAGLFPNLPLSVPHIIASYLFVAYPSPALGGPWPLLVPGWTVNYEVLFYTIFAVALFLPRKVQAPALIAVLLALVIAGQFVPSSSVVAYFYTRPILLEFGAGVLLGLWWKRVGAPPIATGWLLLAAAMSGYVVAALWGSVSIRLFWFGMPTLLLIAGTLSIEHRSASFARIQILRLAGDASYSIYLWHTLVISLVVKLADRFSVPPPVAMAIAALLGVVIGIVLHLLIEKPVLAFFKRPATRHRVPIPGGV